MVRRPSRHVLLEIPFVFDNLATAADEPVTGGRRATGPSGRPTRRRAGDLASRLTHRHESGRALPADQVTAAGLSELAPVVYKEAA